MVRYKNGRGKTINARIKGVFKIEGLTSTNPIAVGDEVEIVLENDADGTAMITKIHDRRNYITRVSPANRNSHHIVASNLDQSIMFATLKDPRTSTGFIDRYLVTCEAYHVPAIIVFNKADIYRQKELDKYEELKSVYTSIGYPVLKISVQKNEGLDEMRDLLKNKTTLVSGHSGVGKSSFINSIFPSFQLKT